MSRPAQSSGTQQIRLSRCGFALWWFAILAIHSVTCVYSTVFANLYLGFELTTFQFILEYNGVGMPRQDYHSVAYVYMALATIHGMCALFIIIGSVWHRKLVFAPRKRNTNTKSSKTMCKKVTSETAATQSARAVRFISAAYHRLGSRHGVLGVKGNHFHVVLICRELVELSLQTEQAVRMSKYLPRVLLNRFYVILLVMNCWSSVFVYSRWFFWRNEARRRFAAIVSDCALNLMTTMGVSFIVMLGYTDGYGLDDFDWQSLDDDELLSQMLNEARVILVMSWSDLVARVIFSLSLVATTADMKALIQNTPERGNRVINTAGLSISLKQNLTAVEPFGNQNGLMSSENSTRRTNQLTSRYSSYKSAGLRNRLSRMLLQGAHSVFAAWGVVVLLLHVHASMQTPLSECSPKVYPMAGALPSCYAVNFDCHFLKISGSKQEVKVEWDRFDRSTAAKLRILHCPSLMVPDSFQDFGVLQEFMVYNSTIMDWGDTAALTNTHHPQMAYMTIIRVNMTGGSLPLGFQALDFPALLNKIIFCETNLETLPDDLDSKWLPESLVYLENSNFTTVPSSLCRLQPFFLLLAGNPISELPPELFEGDIQYIYIGYTLVTELPENVTPVFLSTLEITDTNISYFPSWIDPYVEFALGGPPLVYGGGSTYCSELEQVMSGAITGFSHSMQPQYSSVLMNASESNWNLLSQVVDCSPPMWATQFALEYFDAMYGLGNENASGSSFYSESTL